MSPRSAWLAAALSTCCACDGVGRALVDFQPPSASEPLLCSTMRCEGVLPLLTVPDTPGEYGDLSRCSAPADAEPGNMPLEGCRCQSLELDLSAESPLPVLLIGPGNFQSCRVHLRSAQPFEVFWIASRLENVHISLDGPIALSLRNATLSRVSVAANAPQTSLSFDRCNVSLFSLHSPAQRIPVLHASHSTLVSALLEAELVRFDSVALRSSSLTAGSLDADDLNAGQARLVIDQSLISASRMEQVEVAACSQLRILGSQLSTVEASCRERIDLYSTRAQQSVFNGPIECDAAELMGASFGLSATTSLIAYGSSFTNTSLCRHVRDARFQGGFGSCIDCEGPLVTGEAFLCGEPSFSTEGSENPCPAVAALQSCLSFPDRARPQ